MKKIFLLSSVILLFTSFIFAKNNKLLKGEEVNLGNITGIVRDVQNDTTIEYANIALYSVDSVLITGTISRADGVFTLEKVAYGEYFLIIDFIGYEKTIISDIKVNKKNKEINIGEINLQQATEEIDEIEIIAEKNYIDYKIDKKVINVSQQTNAIGGTAADALENAPSIDVDIEGNVTLRGSSSYTVLIDGKPTVMKGSDLLKQIPSSTIQSIEIITNPSAKYDPEGTAGIINIIMKKENRDGFNGIINLNVATWDKFGGDFTLNYRKNKINFFVNSSYNRNPFHADSENNREMFFTDTSNFVDEVTKRTYTMIPWRNNAGIDYYLNDNNTVSISGTYGGWGMQRLFDTEYHAWTEPNTDEYFSTSNNKYIIDGKYFSGNLNYQHTFSKPEHKIDFNISAWQWNGKMNEQSNLQFTDETYSVLGEEVKSRSDLDNLKNTLESKLDYSLPIKNSKIEAGINTKLVQGTSDFLFENWNNEWDENTDYTNEMFFRRNIFSGYTTFASKLWGFDYQLGLRLEYTDRLLEQKTTNEQYELKLFNYYPTVHISRDLPKNQQIQLSYSRRIKRPQDWQLNPFPGYSDSYNYFQGNPNLEPEDIDSYELNYILRSKKITFSTGFYYRQTNNTQTMTLDVMEENPDIIYLSFDNLDKTEAFGNEIMLNYKPTKWLNFNLGGNVYRQIVSANLVGDDINSKMNSWTSRLTTSIFLSKTTKIQLTAMYNSPTIQGQGTVQQFYMFNAAIRQELFKRKLSISLNVRDIFSTGSYIVEMENNDFSSYFIHKGESPVVRLSISYRINNYKNKRRENINIGEGSN